MPAPVPWHDVSMSGGIALGQHHQSAELTRVRRQALVMIPQMLLETP